MVYPCLSVVIDGGVRLRSALFAGQSLVSLDRDGKVRVGKDREFEEKREESLGRDETKSCPKFRDGLQGMLLEGFGKVLARPGLSGEMRDKDDKTRRRFIK